MKLETLAETLKLKGDPATSNLSRYERSNSKPLFFKAAKFSLGSLAPNTPGKGCPGKYIPSVRFSYKSKEANNLLFSTPTSTPTFVLFVVSHVTTFGSGLGAVAPIIFSPFSNQVAFPTGINCLNVFTSTV